MKVVGCRGYVNYTALRAPAEEDEVDSPSRLGVVVGAKMIIVVVEGCSRSRWYERMSMNAEGAETGADQAVPARTCAFQFKPPPSHARLHNISNV